METNSNYGSPNLCRKPLLDVTKTQAFKEIYAQRLRSYGMLYAKELSGSGSIPTDGNENSIKRFKDHRSNRSVSDPNINLIRTLSLRNSVNFNKKKAYRTSLSDTMLQETLRRRIHSASDAPTGAMDGEMTQNYAHRSLLDLRNTEIPEEGSRTPRLQKRYSLIPNMSRYVEQRLQTAKDYRNDHRRHSTMAYMDCTATTAMEHLSGPLENGKDKSIFTSSIIQTKPKFNMDNNPRLLEAKSRAQKRYASLKSLEMDIMKADEFIARVKRQCAADKRQ